MRGDKPRQAETSRNWTSRDKPRLDKPKLDKSSRGGPVVDFVVFLDVLNLPRYGLGMSIFVIW